MTHIPPSQGLNQLELIARACDFLEHPAIREAAEKAVPCTMPQTVGGLEHGVRSCNAISLANNPVERTAHSVRFFGYFLHSLL